jgi:hypothetical protein
MKVRLCPFLSKASTRPFSSPPRVGLVVQPFLFILPNRSF